MNKTPFQVELAGAVNRVIARLDRGTVGIGRDCLWQMAASDISRLPHAPRGTNGHYYAKQDFNALVATAPLNRFVY